MVCRGTGLRGDWKHETTTVGSRVCPLWLFFVTLRVLLYCTYLFEYVLLYPFECQYKSMYKLDNHTLFLFLVQSTDGLIPCGLPPRR